MFELVARPAAIRFDQITVGKLLLRILIEVYHVGVRRRAVEIKIAFLNVLAVVAFAVGQAKQTLFQDGVPAVPESESKAELLLVIGDSSEAIFTPAVGA